MINQRSVLSKKKIACGVSCSMSPFGWLLSLLGDCSELNYTDNWSQELNLQIIKKLKIPEGKYFCSSCPNMFVGKKAEKRFVNKTRSGKTEIHIILSVIDLSKNPARKKLTARDPFLSKWLCTLQQIVGVKSGGGTSFCVNTEKDFLSKFHR